MQFSIPKFTDEQLVIALTAIRDDLAPLKEFEIEVVPFHPGASPVQLTGDTPHQAPAIQYVIDQHSEIMPNFYLRDPQLGRRIALSINRDSTAITDKVNAPHNDDWPNHIPADKKGPVIVALVASAKKHLRAADVEASFKGEADHAWARYRDLQLEILTSLERAQTTVTTEYSKKVIEAQDAAQKRYEERKVALDEETARLKDELAKQHSDKLAALEIREGAVVAREESFNTKEARYVARHEQQRQIEQIQSWLTDWSLTKGTENKRSVTNWLYIFGALVSIVLTFWFSYENFEYLQLHDPSAVAWWQWILLSLRSLGPFAAFLTFVIYFIRWSATWARQHADEEFRNRARILDIGRTTWLLEAVRDAQDNGRELPEDLLKELSRNLFVYNSPVESGDIDPKSVSDVVLNGLASLRLKSPDGSEIEAKRK